MNHMVKPCNAISGAVMWILYTTVTAQIGFVFIQITAN